jgi:energy-coupling factor transporter ATP-binding protein EcfA2
MRVTSIHLKNFRSFKDSGLVELGSMNVLIGANNAGKSTLIKALYTMQDGNSTIYQDVRLGIGSESTEILIGVQDIGNYFAGSSNLLESKIIWVLTNSEQLRAGNAYLGVKAGDSRNGLSKIPNIDPHHFIVPFLSQRKTMTYHEDVRSQHAMSVNSNLTFLSAKLARLSNPSFPDHKKYIETCQEVLGFVVTSIPSDNGLRPGIYLKNKETISIDQMGEGVPHVVGLLADLALSEGKLFLIEEPENDLHPRALKALLELISQSAEKNQFVISTHSNIVVRHLASMPDSRLYNITLNSEVQPGEAAVTLVENKPDARLAVLRDLGYELYDFDLWDGWLILEESSAERIIRDYLVPWFAPKLSRIRTISANSISQVEANFEDLNRLVRFTHLEEAYRDAVWVRVDGDPIGKETCKKLQDRYATWKPDRFDFFDQEQFERYYPEEFKEDSATALAIQNRQEKRAAKNELLARVRNWLDEDEVRARKALGTSAKCVIAHLQKIESQLLKRGS